MNIDSMQRDWIFTPNNIVVWISTFYTPFGLTLQTEILAELEMYHPTHIKYWSFNLTFTITNIKDVLLRIFWILERVKVYVSRHFRFKNIKINF